MSLLKLVTAIKGGAGSGNFGHGGRPGKRGGSSPKGGSSSMGSNLPFEVTEPRSLREHSNGSQMRELHARDLVKKLEGRSEPGGIKGGHKSGIKDATISTQKAAVEVENTLMADGWQKSGDAYYMLNQRTGTGTKATLRTEQYKPSFYGKPESWTTVEFTSVVAK